MMLLGQPIYGCVDTCKVPKQPTEGEPAPEEPTFPKVWCDLGGCRGVLNGTQQLEEVLGGMSWKARDEDARKFCSLPNENHTMEIDVPAGWDDEEAVTSSMPAA